MAAKVGLVGCGSISGIYLKNGQSLKDIEIAACTDLHMDKARAQAGQYTVPKVYTVEQLMADPEIEIVLNLTVPHAHAPIALQAIEAGKHVYNEKPIGATREEGERILKAAQDKSVLVGSAPDTFLGGAIQTCVKLIDDGVIGRPVSATAMMQCPGPETWHPNPGFLYQPGGGPMFDMGPYYLTALIALLGPARRVAGSCGRAFDTRTITSPLRSGQTIAVATPTHLAGTVDFVNGAIATVVMSFDVWAHTMPHIQIHGTKGSLEVPDPNSFGKNRDALHPIRVWTTDAREWIDVSYTHGYSADSRGVGVADLARAARTGRKQRADGRMANHVLDIMQSFIDSAEHGAYSMLSTTCERPAPLPVGLDDGDLDD